jgi:hypothetical protein
MNTKHTHEQTHCCTCDGCNWGVGDHMRRHSPLRVLLVILGTLAIFWLGFKLGTLKGYVMSEMHNDYNRGHMYFTMKRDVSDGFNQMGSGSATVPVGAPEPANPAIE